MKKPWTLFVLASLLQVAVSSEKCSQYCSCYPSPSAPTDLYVECVVHAGINIQHVIQSIPLSTFSMKRTNLTISCDLEVTDDIKFNYDFLDQIDELHQLEIESCKQVTISNDMVSSGADLRVLRVTGSTTLNFPWSTLLEPMAGVGSSLEVLELIDCHIGMSLDSILASLCPIQYLQKITLSSNQITNPPPPSSSPSSSLSSPPSSTDTHFSTCFSRLTSLDLSSNLLTSLDSAHPFFSNQSTLHHLHLNRNRIQHLSPRFFQHLPRLVSLDLSENSLQISGIAADFFALFPLLEDLNLSENMLMKFNTTLLTPLKRLVSLQLRNSGIHDFHDDTGMSTLENLIAIDLSSNFLEEIPISFRDLLRLRNVLLIRNRLRSMQTERWPVTLDSIDLRENVIESLPFPQVEYLEHTGFHSRIHIALADNPFLCDCHLAWIGASHETSKYQIVDYKELNCLTWRNELVAIEDMAADEFLCNYTELCTTDCTCCEFNGCDCNLQCPETCHCFHNGAGINIVDCSSRNLTSIPLRLPVGASELRLDGNSLNSLDSTSLLTQYKLQKLYLNNSGIHSISPSTWAILSNLEEIHLDNNRLGEFVLTNDLPKLATLTLAHNNLSLFNKDLSWHLRNLRFLNIRANRFDENCFESLRNWTSLVTILFAGNRLTGCSCSELISLHQIAARINDSGEIECDARLWNQLFDEQRCTTSLAVCGISRAELAIVAALTVLLIILVAILIVFSFRYSVRLRVLWFKKFGHRPFDRDSSGVESFMKHDALILYTSEEEDFLQQELIPQLERRSPVQHQLQARQLESLPLNGSLDPAAEVSESFDSSKRILIVCRHEYSLTDLPRTFLELLFRHRLRLILITTQQIEVSYNHPLLKSIRRQCKMYLKESDRDFWVKLIYAMPQKSAEPSVKVRLEKRKDRAGHKYFLVENSQFGTNY